MVWLLPSQVEAQSSPPNSTIRALTGDNYPERIAAQEELAQWANDQGKDSWPWLLKQAKTSTEPEIQERAFSVLKQTVLEDLTNKRPGFVGVRMSAVQLKNGAHGVQINEVTRDSPADKVGLRVKDVILTLDGKAFEVKSADMEFGHRVAELSPGDEVKLQILRGGEELEVRLTLGVRPWSAGEFGQVRPLRARFGFRNDLQGLNEDQARDEAFRTWFLEHSQPDSPDAQSKEQK